VNETTNTEAPARCCGEQPASTRGGPIALACLLCPTSPVYWRAEPSAAARLAAVAEHHATTGSWLPDLSV
jgi:hypothetical protein